MALTYTTLTGAKSVEGSIKDWVARTDVPSATVLTEAEAWIYQSLRTREMMARDDDFTFSTSSSSVALPSDFLDPIGFVPYGYSNKLPLVDYDNLDEKRNASTGAMLSGTPSRWTVLGVTAYADMTPSTDMVGVLSYYAQPDALSDSNETNFLTSRYPTLLRRACLMFAWEWARNWPRREEELKLAEMALQEAKTSNDLFRRDMIYPG